MPPHPCALPVTSFPQTDEMADGKSGHHHSVWPQRSALTIAATRRCCCHTPFSSKRWNSYGAGCGGSPNHGDCPQGVYDPKLSQGRTKKFPASSRYCLQTRVHTGLWQWRPGVGFQLIGAGKDRLALSPSSPPPSVTTLRQTDIMESKQGWQSGGHTSRVSSAVSLETWGFSKDNSCNSGHLSRVYHMPHQNHVLSLVLLDQ